MDLNGKVALVTGAVGGIGGGFVRMLLQKGCKVCMVDIREDAGREDERSLREMYGEDRVVYVNCDVTKPSDIEHAFDVAAECLGVVEIVCNNAGVPSELTYTHTIDVNYTGVCHGTQIGIDRMRKDKGGKGGVIVNTSSICGLYPIWFNPAYCGTKAAVINYTRCWSLNPDRESMGIRFNTLCPSVVTTTLQQSALNTNLDKTGKAHWELNDTQGYLSIEEVSAALCRLVEEDQNGAVLFISKKEGIKFVELPVLQF